MHRSMIFRASKRSLAALLFTFTLLLLTAGGLAAQEKMKETSYYPLQVGATWHYRSGERKFMIRVAKHEKVGQTLCALLETVRDGKVIGTEHLAVTADGVYRHDLTGKTQKQSITMTLQPPILVLKLPPEKGASWKIDSTSDGRKFRGEFVVEEQEVTVQAGKYKTFRVRSKDLEVNSVKTSIASDYAEGVGMVKQVIESGGEKIEIELERFEAGK